MFIRGVMVTLLTPWVKVKLSGEIAMMTVWDVNSRPCFSAPYLIDCPSSLAPPLLDEFRSKLVAEPVADDHDGFPNVGFVTCGENFFCSADEITLKALSTLTIEQPFFRKLGVMERRELDPF